MSIDFEKAPYRAAGIETTNGVKRHRLSKRWVAYMYFLVLWFAGAVTSIVGAIVDNHAAGDLGTALSHFALVVLVVFLMDAPAMFKAKR